MFPVARSSFCGTAVHHVLPVLWTMSGFPIMYHMVQVTQVKHKQSSECLTVVQHRWNTAVYTQTDSPVGYTGPGAESDVYDCLVDL